MSLNGRNQGNPKERCDLYEAAAVWHEQVGDSKNSDPTQSRPTDDRMPETLQDASFVERPELGEAEYYTCGLASRMDVRLVRERYICKQKRIRRERLRSLALSIA
jgi:hypothetical protein